MIKLLINKIEKYEYELKDKDDKIYNFNIEFYDVEKEIKVGDNIILNEKILNEGNSLLSFGKLDSKYGKEISSSEDKDLIMKKYI